MPSILSTGTAVPPYAMKQEDARRLARVHFAGKITNIERYLEVFDNALVSERYFCVPPEWFGSEQSLGSTNRLYLEWAEKLAIQAVDACLQDAHIEREEIDHIVFVSSTGIATPSLDVAVISAMDLRADIRRVPLFGLGCAGGAAGIAICGALAQAAPGAAVLLVSLELDSLTFQRNDFSKSNLVATSLFGDGAAAVLIRDEGGPVEILESVSLLKRGTRGLMGWDFVDTGFRVVFSRRVPTVIQEMMPGAVDELLGARGLVVDDITSFIVHPGGRRILEVYEALFDKGPEQFSSSYAILRRFGNMSSATVLFVLDEELRSGRMRSGEFGLLAAFGPGFSAEATLLCWS